MSGGSRQCLGDTANSLKNLIENFDGRRSDTLVSHGFTTEQVDPTSHVTEPVHPVPPP